MFQLSIDEPYIDLLMNQMHSDGDACKETCRKTLVEGMLSLYGAGKSAQHPDGALFCKKSVPGNGNFEDVINIFKRYCMEVMKAHENLKTKVFWFSDFEKLKNKPDIGKIQKMDVLGGAGGVPQDGSEMGTIRYSMDIPEAECLVRPFTLESNSEVNVSKQFVTRNSLFARHWEGNGCKKTRYILPGYQTTASKWTHSRLRHSLMRDSSKRVSKRFLTGMA